VNSVRGFAKTQLGYCTWSRMGVLDALSPEPVTEPQWRLIESLFFSPGGFHRAAEDARAAATSFREFYDQMLARRAKQLPSQRPASTSSDTGATTGDLGLPARYDPRYRLNFSLLGPGGSPADPHGLDRPATSEAARRAGLDGAALRAVRLLVHLHEDFAQKRNLAALRKAAQERALLPIAPLAGRIVEGLERSQVVLVVGATGCGKSTQVPRLLLSAGYNKVQDQPLILSMHTLTIRCFTTKSQNPSRDEKINSTQL